MITTTALSLLPLLPAAAAWGDFGHQTVAYIAQNFVQPATVTWAQNILGDTSSSYLANYATWADTYRYTTAGEFSQPYHFIDAEDNPPSSCGVVYTRDCGTGGCVVSAITNYTQRVQDGRLTATNTAEALYFLIHFLGDITQPLHDENLAYGGNDIDVTFEGTSTNLHHIWDTNMLQKYRDIPQSDTPTLADAESWAAELTTEIQSGEYESDAAGWVTGLNIKAAQNTSMAWAIDANAQNCAYVLVGGESAVENKELDGTYYTNAIPVFTMQLAKGGYRLAKYLDAIAAAN